jgi:glycosyltransferase involved in cell wall biosynthesis
MKTLSVVIITFNEEENIGKCLESVKQVADEVVVVDSFSTDKTPAIATAAGARFFYHKFAGHIEQKNFARTKAVNDWVLSLDADETLSYELLAQLVTWKKEPEDEAVSGYVMNRLNFYCGKPIKTCGMYPDQKLRLWQRNAGSWQGINPHDKFVLNEPEKARFMKGDILHNTWPTYRAFVTQVDKFATISAQHLKDKSIFFLLIKMVFSPPFKFIRIYFFKAGFTEGLTGLIICFHQSREVFLKYWRAIKFKLQA